VVGRRFLSLGLRLFYALMPDALRWHPREHEYKEASSLCDKNLVSRFAQNQAMTADLSID